MSKYRFKLSYRLRAQADFKQIFSPACDYSIATRHLFLHARNNGLEHPRLGIKVSRKVAKRSTHRNRIKRIIREEFRLRLAALPAMDIVAVCRARGEPVALSAWTTLVIKAWDQFAPPARFS